MMYFNFSGKRDVYLEIADKFKEYIDKGIYNPGDKLPSVRQVAEDFGVNPNTAARAYSYLEEQGIIHTLPKKGVYVSENNTVSSNINMVEAVKCIEKLKDDGLSYEEITEIIKGVYKK
jgi:GntR family transcriptional regulator